MPTRNQHHLFAFRQARFTFHAEEVDESWALKLINECTQEDVIRVESEGYQVELVQSEPQCALVPPVTAPSAIDLQKLYWESRPASSKKTADAACPAVPTLKRLLRKLIRA